MGCDGGLWPEVGKCWWVVAGSDDDVGDVKTFGRKKWWLEKMAGKEDDDDEEQDGFRAGRSCILVILI